MVGFSSGHLFVFRGVNLWMEINKMVAWVGKETIFTVGVAVGEICKREIH